MDFRIVSIVMYDEKGLSMYFVLEACHSLEHELNDLLLEIRYFSWLRITYMYVMYLNQVSPHSFPSNSSSTPSPLFLPNFRGSLTHSVVVVVIKTHRVHPHSSDIMCIHIGLSPWAQTLRGYIPEENNSPSFSSNHLSIVPWLGVRCPKPLSYPCWNFCLVCPCTWSHRC